MPMLYEVATIVIFLCKSNKKYRKNKNDAEIQQFWLKHIEEEKKSRTNFQGR